MLTKTFAATCALVFILVMAITQIIPAFPPAAMIYEFLKFSQNSTVIFGIPAVNILMGMTNGFFWIIIAAVLYGVASYASRAESLPPMPEAPHLRSPKPSANPADPRISKIPPAMTVTKRNIMRRPRTEYEIEAIQGIGLIRGMLLRDMGIKTSEDLLHSCKTERVRHRIAKDLGVSEETLLVWICQADLLRVRGVGKHYSELLESAGVNTVADLSTRSPTLLRQTLKIVNKEKNLVKRVPPVGTIQIWVNDAQTLEHIIE